MSKKKRTPKEHKDTGTLLDTRAKKPKMYKVILHNDDFTTMEFVIEVLMRFFQKDITQATRMMFQVHYEGSTIGGVYTREIAEMKVEQVLEYARACDHPFQATMEPA